MEKIFNNAYKKEPESYNITYDFEQWAYERRLWTKADRSSFETIDGFFDEEGAKRVSNLCTALAMKKNCTYMDHNFTVRVVHSDISCWEILTYQFTKSKSLKFMYDLVYVPRKPLYLSVDPMTFQPKVLERPLMHGGYWRLWLGELDATD